MDDESILDAARKAKEAGAIRFSIVTSGRNTSNPNEFNQILRVLKRNSRKNWFRNLLFPWFVNL